MRQKIIIGIVILALCLFANTAMALKCGNLFIEPGVTSAEVLINCGEPVTKEVLGAYGKSGDVKERWTYGPQGGNYYFLYFRAGILEKVDSKTK